MKKYFLILVSAILLFFGNCKPAEQTATETKEQPQYYKPKFLRYDNYVYEDNIRTVQFYQLGNPLSYPQLFIPSTRDANTKLVLEFDELNGKIEDYYVNIIHCDADWNPSSLLTNEYLSGFFSERITNHNNSLSTYIPYVHYRYEFPNGMMHFLLSGNYLLKVYRGFDENDLLLTRRFIVAEDIAFIQPDIRVPVSSDLRRVAHQINCTIDTKDFPVNNMYTDLKVVLLQNYRWDNALYDVKPSFILGSQMQFDFSAKNIFLAGNEFRRADFRNLYFRTQQVQRIDEENGKFTVTLFPDKLRAFGKYFTNPDFNGLYYIDVENKLNPNIASEYAEVKFCLQMPEPILDGNVHLFGSLSDWQTYDRFKMFYNDSLKAYTATLLLKQGVYDYEYVVRGDKSDALDEKRFEGSFAETDDVYTLLVYYKSQFDPEHSGHRLIGMRNVSYQY